MHYTCVPDSVYPWDPVIMKRIREFAPDAQPLWIKWVFRSPEDEENPHDVVYGRHALGRYLNKGRTEMFPFKCTMPNTPYGGFMPVRPNNIWFIHDGARDEKNQELPGNYLPFDDTILDRAEKSAIGMRMSDKEYREFLVKTWVTDKLEARAKRREAWAKDMEERRKHLEPYARKMYDAISDVEWDEIEGRQTNPTPYQPKLYIT